MHDRIEAVAREQSPEGRAVANVDLLELRPPARDALDAIQYRSLAVAEIVERKPRGPLSFDRGGNRCSRCRR
jgi:hypothetical protein